MVNTIQSLKERVNKYFLQLLAATFFLGVIGWFLPVGQDQSTYRLEASLTLGNYNNPELNNPKRVSILLLNAPFYQEHLKNLWADKFEEISTNLQVTVGPDNIINLSYSDHSEKHTAQVLNEITDAFMAVDQARFQEKQKIIQESIDRITNEKVGSEAKVDQQRFLYELKTAQYDIKPATLLKPADIQAINTENRAFNSKERAVLGILLGITLSFLWIVFPVIFREQSY